MGVCSVSRLKHCPDKESSSRDSSDQIIRPHCDSVRQELRFAASSKAPKTVGRPCGHNADAWRCSPVGRYAAGADGGSCNGYRNQRSASFNKKRQKNEQNTAEGMTI